MTNPAASATLVAPASVTLSASASASTGSITKVEFFVGSTLLGSATTSPYQYYWHDVAAGSYTLSVTATDDTGATSTVSVAVTVGAGTLLLVDGGTFTIGADSVTRSAPAHAVTLSNFYLSKYELTFDEYDAYTDATDAGLVSSSYDNVDYGRGQKPVFNVSWCDAIEYCNWRSAQEGLTAAYTIDKSTQDSNNTDSTDTKKWTVTLNLKANGYRLPTEAEWEYAARGGSASQGYLYSGSNDATEVAWFGAGEDGGTATTKGNASVVGQKKANELGLYDMSGNVHEWVWDKYDTARVGYDVDAGVVDPTGITGTFNRFIIRGGQTGAPASCLLLTNRFVKKSTFTMCPAGFRIARTPG